jgi:hypothetical protein
MLCTDFCIKMCVCFVECTWHKLYCYFQYYYFWFLSSICFFVYNKTEGQLIS